MWYFPLDLRDHYQDRAWRHGSLWLSLDRFERFWPDFELTLSHGEAVKAAMRTQQRATYADDERIRAAEEDERGYSDDVGDLARKCFRTLFETAGAEDAECVARWLRGPMLAYVKEPRWHRVWSSMLYHVWEMNPDEIESLYGIPGDTVRKIVEIATRFRSEVDMNRERVEAADEELLSGWDAVAYAAYRWETSFLSPFDGLGLHLRFMSFDRAWSEILHCTHPADIEGLSLWGQAFLRTYDWQLPDYCAILPEEARRVPP